MNYVLYGEEHYLLKEALEKIKKEAGCDQNAMNLITYHARQDKLRAVLDDAMTVPFLRNRRSLSSITVIFYVQKRQATGI